MKYIADENFVYFPWDFHKMYISLRKTDEKSSFAGAFYWGITELSLKILVPSLFYKVAGLNEWLHNDHM